MRIAAATEARLWITHVVMPVIAVSALVYINNKDKIHEWLEEQRLKKKSRYPT